MGNLSIEQVDKIIIAIITVGSISIGTLFGFGLDLLKDLISHSRNEKSNKNTIKLDAMCNLRANAKLHIEYSILAADNNLKAHYNWTLYNYILIQRLKTPKINQNDQYQQPNIVDNTLSERIYDMFSEAERTATDYIKIHKDTIKELYIALVKIAYVYNLDSNILFDYYEKNIININKGFESGLSQIDLNESESIIKVSEEYKTTREKLLGTAKEYEEKFKELYQMIEEKDKSK